MRKRNTIWKAVAGATLGASLIAGTAAWSAAASGDANATAKTPAPTTGMSCPMMGGGMMNDQNDAQGGGMMGMMQMMQGCRKMMGDQNGTQDGTQKGGMKGMSCPMMGDKGAATDKAAQATQEKNLQRATITIADGYQPATLNVQAGKPLELTFLSKSDSCANTVNIPALKQSFSLKNGARKTITFTPQKGTTAFSCAMGMYRGQIVAK